MRKTIVLSLLSLILSAFLASAAFAGSLGGEMKKAEKSLKKSGNLEKVVKKNSKKLGSVFKKGAYNGKSVTKKLKK